MRIAFLTTEYPTEMTFAGGLASYVHRTARLLHDLGHEVEVFTLSQSDEQITDQGTIVHRVKPSGRIVAISRRCRLYSTFPGYTKVASRSWPLAQSLRRRHRSTPFDVVQAASCFACGLAATYRPVAPVVTRISSYTPAWRAANEQITTLADRQNDRNQVVQMNRSAAVYAPSRLVADMLLKNEQIAASVIEPPFDRSSLNQIDRSCPSHLPYEGYGLFFGSIKPMKGCDRLLDVLPSILTANPDFRFAFVGNTLKNPAGELLKRKLLETFAPFGDRVCFVPACHHEELFQYVANARFVILPSRIDNLPNTALEAMALGRVVIGTQNASFDQLIDDRHNGFVVPQSNEAIQTAIETAWNLNHEQRRRIGTAAEESIDRLNPKSASSELSELFEQVATKKQL